jgi:hypothetical protein
MAKTKTWFIKTRASYLPNSWQAWALYIPYLAYLVSVIVFVLNRKDSFWLALFTVVPNWIAAALIMSWLARFKS